MARGLLFLPEKKILILFLSPLLCFVMPLRRIDSFLTMQFNIEDASSCATYFYGEILVTLDCYEQRLGLRCIRNSFKNFSWGWPCPYCLSRCLGTTTEPCIQIHWIGCEMKKKLQLINAEPHSQTLLFSHFSLSSSIVRSILFLHTE